MATAGRGWEEALILALILAATARREAASTRSTLFNKILSANATC